jgi:hypothetical protein
MYKIVGGDGKEYGPVSMDVVQKWIKEGRANAQTRIQGQAQEWKPLAEYPELAALLPNRATPPLTAGATPNPLVTGLVGERSSGLAITSLVLGILSLVGCTIFTAIPAVICGHIARSRASSSPERYGGAGLAMGGLVTGYIGLAISIFILPAALLLPALSKAKERATSINCMNNMKQIGLAYKMWEVDHNGQFPWAVSVAKGGTMELAIPGRDNLDPNPIHFEVLSNQLATPKILVCVSDKTNTVALQFQNLQPNNVSYQLHTGTSVSDANPSQVLVFCPIHGNTLTCDGSVRMKPRARTQTKF